MNKLILSLFVLCFVAQPVFAQSPRSLAFLSGCWSALDEDGNKVTEDWFKSTENVLLGVSQTKNKANEMIEHGFLDIHQEMPNQDITFTGTFPGHSPTPLVLTSIKKMSETNITAVFSNPTGVVKTMTYTLKAKDILNIRYEGSGKSGEGFDFNYEFSRENCANRF